jgi:hypothetical protein
MRPCFAGAILAATVFASACHGQAQPAYRPKTVLARPMPAITDPQVIPAARAEIADNELVIGVSIDGQSRAYPINQLTGPRREIINDVLAGTAIAATW